MVFGLNGFGKFWSNLNDSGILLLLLFTFITVLLDKSRLPGPPYAPISFLIVPFAGNLP